MIAMTLIIGAETVTSANIAPTGTQKGANAGGNGGGSTVENIVATGGANDY